MIDILMYLFETYGHVETCPQETDLLTHQLFAAGFDGEEIAQAIEWLSGLSHFAQTTLTTTTSSQKTIRAFAKQETDKLNFNSLNFLIFLENSKVLTAIQREMIIDRAMALPQSNIGLSKFKVIVLMVLWQQQVVLDSLMVEELLSEESEEDSEENEYIEETNGTFFLN